MVLIEHTSLSDKGVSHRRAPCIRPCRSRCRCCGAATASPLQSVSPTAAETHSATNNVHITFRMFWRCRLQRQVTG